MAETTTLPGHHTEFSTAARECLLATDPLIGWCVRGRVSYLRDDNTTTQEMGQSALNPYMANMIAGATGWYLGNAHEARLEWVLQYSTATTIAATAARCQEPQVQVVADFGRGGRHEVTAVLPQRAGESTGNADPTDALVPPPPKL